LHSAYRVSQSLLMVVTIFMDENNGCIGAVGSVPEVNQSVPDLCKFAAEMNPRSSTKESVLRIFTKFVCSLSGTEQLDLKGGHPATLHALCGLLIGDDVMLKMFAALI